MFLYPRSKNRPFHLGPYPLETLRRDTSLGETALQSPAQLPAHKQTGLLARSADFYQSIFTTLVDGQPLACEAGIPSDLDRRAVDIKGAAYFMDADQVGVCKIPAGVWTTNEFQNKHDYAVVLLIEHARLPEVDNLAHDWLSDSIIACANLRAAEIACCLAGHIRNMGFAARAHVAQDALLDARLLSVLAGLNVSKGDQLKNPFVKSFSLAAVSTGYELSIDQPLGADAVDTGRVQGLKYWLGVNGAQSGRERNRQAKRASHLSRYPMETIKRVEKPTTLILENEVPRVPKRAAFFERAIYGDLGEKSKKERTRFATKHPLSFAQVQLIRAMVEHQDGEIAQVQNDQYKDAKANAKAIKSLSYVLGSDLTGVCKIPDYAWFSHHSNGDAITPYHRYAIVMLVDQGFETMEGASGDDWISGAQSMRGYLRGATIAGVMANFLRDLGFSSRPQTNADSDVLHIPLILQAGLGELSRIGELVLNPFVGPRFKSVIVTTNMPLEVDKPIDFGLQNFCNSCMKCARECPCDAIPYGHKVMFNGYEIWKPDVERCTRYRLTNSKGSACGRCMKTCPLNKVIDSDGALLTRAASWMGVNAMWAKPLIVPFAEKVDDWLGNGKINPLKKWWFDHEIVNGVTVSAKGANARELESDKKVDAGKQKIAFYHANMMPPPNAKEPVMLNRKEALAAAELVETPDEAKRRAQTSQAKPVHYEAAKSL